MTRRRTKPIDVVEQLKKAAESLLSAEESVRSHIQDVVKKHEDQIVFLTFEDNRVLKLYSCSLRCRHCAICKCGVVVWRESRDNRRFRFLSPFDWIDDPEDLILSSLVNVLSRLARVPSLLVLSIPRGCYEDANHLILGLAFLIDLLPIRQIHVFLSNSGHDESFHFAHLKKDVVENSCRTVQEVAFLPLPDSNLWMTSVGMPLFRIVDVTCTLPTNQIDNPTTFFVLARNKEGAVTYRTSAFLPDKMWKELDWSMEIPRLMQKYEEERARSARGSQQPQQNGESREESPPLPLFAALNGGTVGGEEESQEANIDPQKKEIKKEVESEDESEDGATMEEGAVMEGHESSSQSSSIPRRGGRGAAAGTTPVATAEPPAKRRKSTRTPRMLLELRHVNLSPDKVSMDKESVKSAKKPAVKRREKRKSTGTVIEEEGEEEEEDEQKEGDGTNPYGAVIVFQRTNHGSEERCAIAAKMLPTVPRLERPIEKTIKKLEKNGDATDLLIDQWKNIGEMAKPSKQKESLLEVLQDIASRMHPIAPVHPVIDPQCFFHD